jgi:GNAT superfamily N-acetyltransferase
MRYTSHRNDQALYPGGGMDSDNRIQIRVRDATGGDIPTLTDIKGVGTEIIHRDRLRDAQHTGFRYLVLLLDNALIGFACLIGRRPSYWSDANDVEHLPQIVDLQVRESHRGKGCGSAFVRALERIAAQAGNNHLYLSVDPVNNRRAYIFYQRLGYQPEQLEPYRKAWEFRDSQGNIHSGEDWVIDLVKQVSA